MKHPHSIRDMRERYGARHRWLMLLSLMVGTMASIMSSTVVNVAIPDMSRQFTLGQERAQWVSSGFMVAMTVSMLTTPWLLARFGYRRTYIGAILLLMAGGIFGGLAPWFGLVLAMRVAEGLAAGVLQPIPAIVMLRGFEGADQARAGSLFGMTVVLAPAIGPSVGGLLVDHFGWRSIFFMVIPFCLLSVWLARRYVPMTGPGDTVAAADEAPLDWRGLLMGSVGTLCLLNGLVELHSGLSATPLVLLGVAAVALATFVWWQREQLRHHRAPLMDLRLFRHAPFAMGSLVSFIYGIALFGSSYLIPVFMQAGLHLSASLVGSVLLPAGLVLAVTIALVGRVSHKTPTRVLVSVGLALLTLSFVLMLPIEPGMSLVWLLLISSLGRVGLGFVLTSLQMGAMRGVDRALISQGSSTINFLRTLGGAAGVNLCGIVLEWRLGAHGQSLASAGSPRGLAAFDETFIMLAVVCGAAIIAAWRIQHAPAAKD